MKYSARIAALFLLLAVAAGAFGAHALRGVLTPYQVEVYEKAIFYQFVHGLGALIVALGGQSFGLAARTIQQICWAFFGGIMLFSGSLFMLVLTGNVTFGAITPLGGIMFMVAWGTLAFQLKHDR